MQVRAPTHTHSTLNDKICTAALRSAGAPLASHGRPQHLKEDAAWSQCACLTATRERLDQSNGIGKRGSHGLAWVDGVLSLLGSQMDQRRSSKRAAEPPRQVKLDGGAVLPWRHRRVPPQKAIFRTANVILTWLRTRFLVRKDHEFVWTQIVAHSKALGELMISIRAD
jgi:hypothetical protein